ncbi:MAG: Si-specific NAD(P)(+) transhydrogenase [Acidobacteriota bacterium]
MSDAPYDLVVIGAGPAGEKAATQAAYFGKRVAIVERRDTPGGIAVSDAGVPTKTLRETAQYLTGFRQRDVYGVSLSLGAAGKLERLRSRVAGVKAVMTEAVRSNIERMRVELHHGTARLAAGKRVIVSSAAGERELRAGVILIATGSHPLHPPGIDFSDPGITDSEGILGIETLPGRLVVIGGGAVGCEYASIFTALGVEVTLLEAMDRLLGFADGEIAALLARAFGAEGMRVTLGACVDAITRTGRDLSVALRGGATLAADRVLFAGGRAGNTEGLGLDEAGVRIDDKGRIVVDAHYRTSAEGIYAAGDVIGPPALASVSQEQGRVAACHAFSIPFKHVVDPLAPFGVYAIPEVAMAGLTEEAARAAGIDCEVGRGLFARNTRARIAGTTEGMVKLVFRRDDRTLLGVHILGDIASELIHIGQLVASERRPIDYFIHATFNVPTYSEAYKYAAYDGLQRLSRA